MSRAELIAALTPKYVWWPLEGTETQRTRRVLAQVMNFGTYDDIRRIEDTFERQELIDALSGAEPGWLTPRSWEFWRGRLSLSPDDAVLPRPPRRSFDAGTLQART